MYKQYVNKDSRNHGTQGAPTPHTYFAERVLSGPKFLSKKTGLMGCLGNPRWWVGGVYVMCYYYHQQKHRASVCTLLHVVL